MSPKKHKHISSSSSSSSDEEQNVVDDVATSHDNTNDVVADDETAELNKLILTNSEPVYDKPTMNINDTKIVFGKNRLLPVNRNIKNNFPNVATQETSPVEQPPKQSPVEKPKHKHTRKHKKKHKDDSSDEEVNQPTSQFMPSVPVDTTPNDIITVYPDYNGPFKVNKKVFRICYITIVAVMLITLVFIVMLQNFRRYLMITQPTNQPIVQGGNVDDETPHDEQQQTQTSEIPNDDLFGDVFKPTRLRDSKGRFVKTG